MPPLMPTNVPAPLAQISALPLPQYGPCIQPSAVNPPPHISSFILQLYLIPLQPSVLCAYAAPPPPPPPPLYILLQGRGEPLPPPSAVRAHAPLLSALLTQPVEPPLQPSAVNPSPLPQILALPPQRYVLPLQSLFMRSPPPPLSF